MRTTAKYYGTQKTLEGDLVVSYIIPDTALNLQGIAKQKDQKLTLETKKFFDKKSNDQNGYFWALCQEIAQTLKAKQWDVYLTLLEDSGNFIETRVKTAALPDLQNKYRLVKELYTEEIDGENFTTVHCYFGCSSFTTREMSKLLDLTIEQAKALGIETATPEELERWRHV